MSGSACFENGNEPSGRSFRSSGMLRGIGSQLVFDTSVQIFGPIFKWQSDQFECWGQLDGLFCRVLCGG